MAAITKAIRSTSGSTPTRSPSPARTPATHPFRVSRVMAVSVSLGILPPAAAQQPAEHEDRADRPGEHDRHPPEGEMEAARGVDQQQRAEGGDHHPRRERYRVDLHFAAHAL